MSKLLDTNSYRKNLGELGRNHPLMISEVKWVIYIFEFSDRNSFASTVLYDVEWEIMKLHSLSVNDTAECVFVEQQKGLEL
jgi:hypothetical protein